MDLIGFQQEVMYLKFISRDKVFLIMESHQMVILDASNGALRKATMLQKIQ